MQNRAAQQARDLYCAVAADRNVVHNHRVSYSSSLPDDALLADKGGFYIGPYSKTLMC